MNNVSLVGRITKDLELKKTQKGTSVVSFSLACNRDRKVEGQPDADFINCVAWNKVADLITTYMHKGSQLGVNGRIQTRNYDGNDGKKVYITEVVIDKIQFLDSKNTSGNKQENFPEQEQGDFPSQTLDIASDDLPF